MEPKFKKNDRVVYIGQVKHFIDRTFTILAPACFKQYYVRESVVVLMEDSLRLLTPLEEAMK